MAGRYALLIGNSDFEDEDLPDLVAPTNDVIALRDVLERPEIAGFETKFLLNAGMEQARRAISALFRDKTADDLVLLYYTGHGLRDENDDLYFAMPGTRAADPTEISLEADFVKKQMDRSASRRQVLILDCCHSGAFKGSGAKGGDSQPKLFRKDFNPGGHGRFILAASAANESAFEYEGQSIFTRHLVDGLQSGEAAPEKREITIHDLHTFVSRRVAAERAPMRPRLWVDEQTMPLILAWNPFPRRPLPAELEQLLWDKDSWRALGGATQLIDIYNGTDAQLALDAERVLRERLTKPADLSVLVADKIRAALQAKPSHGDSELRTAELDRRLAVLEARLAAETGTSAEPAPPLDLEIAEVRAQIVRTVAELESPPLGPSQSFQDASFSPEMVALPAGSFLMGSPDDETGRRGTEGPQRQVTVASFAIGRYPVTLAEYDHFCDGTGRDKPDDEGWGRGRMPAINVSWDDAAMYAMWLSEQTGKTYRLPSEAEWEYACRAGTQTAYWWGDVFDPRMANTDDGGPDRTTEVGSFPANAWGLFDTLGNVVEWVEDHWHGNYRDAPNDGRAWLDAAADVDRPRVLRGGSWGNDQVSARCANRGWFFPYYRYCLIGFRVVCSLPS